MTMVEAKVKQWGNSLGLIISKDIVKVENLNIGDIVKVDIEKEKRVDGFGIMKNVPSFEEDKEEHPEFW
jgi:hypothetical protein|tara:strand:- start:954 stop:1160 length:207 start_codon:yes stop_codon:yes gene_type:complete